MASTAFVVTISAVQRGLRTTASKVSRLSRAQLTGLRLQLTRTFFAAGSGESERREAGLSRFPPITRPEPTSRFTRRGGESTTHHLTYGSRLILTRPRRPTAQRS